VLRNLQTIGHDSNVAQGVMNFAEPHQILREAGFPS
jgi:hypothetical protein